MVVPFSIWMSENEHAAAMSVLATKKTEPEDPPVVSTVLNSRANAFL
jgi:hypothetical protein